MLNQTLTAVGYIIAGFEAVFKSSDLAKQAEAEAISILSKIDSGNDCIVDSAWTYSFLCSHLYIAYLVQSWFTLERVAKATELAEQVKQYVLNQFDTISKSEAGPVQNDKMQIDIKPESGQLQRLRDEKPGPVTTVRLAKSVSID